MIPSTFFQFQALCDLRALAARADDAVRARTLSLVPSKLGVGDLDRLIAGRGCRLDPDDPVDLHDTLLLAATVPTPDRGAFVMATAILLADRLQGGAGTDDLWHHWDTLRDVYETLPAPARSAICRGFYAAHATGRVRLDAPPTGAALASASRDAVAADLFALARTLGEDEIAAVARADYGREQADHEAALRVLLGGPDGMLPPLDDRWFPAEVVELVSHVPGRPGFAQCTAVVLIEALRLGDPHDNASYRWSSIAPAYAALPPAQREPIFAGFRALCERDPDWNPYFDWTEAKIASDGVAIPLPSA